MDPYQTGYDDALAGRPDQNIGGRYAAGYESGKGNRRLATIATAAAAMPANEEARHQERMRADRAAAKLDLDRRVDQRRADRDDGPDNTELPSGGVF